MHIHIHMRMYVGMYVYIFKGDVWAVAERTTKSYNMIYCNLLYYTKLD